MLTIKTPEASQQPLAIATKTLPDAVVDAIYETVIGASGGVPPYRWTSSALPAGLTLDGGGTISGLPATPSAATPVTFTVTDSAGTTASASLSIEVLPLAEPLAVTTTSLPNATTGVGYKTPLEASGGTPPYRWALTSGALPPGLSLDSSGAISGTTSAETVVQVTVQVTDQSGLTATATFSISVTPALQGPFLIQFIGAPLANVCLQAANPGPNALVTIAPIDTKGLTPLQQWLYGSDQRLYLSGPVFTTAVCLSFGNPPANGNPLLLSLAVPTDETQQWTWSGQSNTSTFINVGAPGFCCDVEGGVATPGTKVQIWQTLANTNQAFALTLIPAFATGETSQAS